MTTENKTYTADDIHYFTCSKGRSWAHMPWEIITGEVPGGVVYPAVARDRASAWSCWVSGNRSYTYPTRKQGDFAVIPADRIEVVTEHVEATEMDALQALVASGGEPLEGWHFNDGRGSTRYSDGDLAGLRLNGAYPFISSDFREWKHAFRPLTRVRIKAEVKPINTREVPEGVAPLPEDKPWLAYVGKGDGEDSGGCKPWCYTNTGFSIYSEWDNASGKGYHPILNEGWHYGIDVRHPEAQERFPEVCKAHNYVEPKPATAEESSGVGLHDIVRDLVIDQATRYLIAEYGSWEAVPPRVRKVFSREVQGE